ncbi:MAG: PEGA domain-containing protein [Calditrichaceae bacterium]
MTKEGARATSEYINKKKITGLESNIKSFSFNKKSMGIIAGIIVLFLIVIIFLSDSSPEKIKINSNDVSYSSIGLNWQKYDNADHYIIHRKKANESEYQFIRKITLNAFIDSMVAPNEKYIYRITANDNDDKILAIGEIDLNTPKLDLKMKVSNITSSKIRLSWPQVENNPLYILYRKDKNSDIKPGREIYRGNENNYEDRYLKPDHSYSYILRIQFDNLQEVELAGLNVMTGPLPKISHPVDVKKQFFGDLQVNSTPPEAVVFLDGQKIGTTPLIKTGLKTGNYNLVVRKEGCKDFTSHVNIKRGEMIRVNSVLSFLKGRLSIQVLPYGSIFINDKLVIENTPVKYSKEYNAGTYKVKVVHERIKALWEKTITIKGNEEKKIYIDFNKKVKVTITSNPWGTIFIDGKSTFKEMVLKWLKNRKL